MAVDQAVAEAVQAETAPPTLRFYTWRRRTLSLGYGQPASLVRVDRASELGIDVVRRPTGGQAILHHDELTYSVALPRRHPIAARGVVDSYDAISEALIGGMTALGLVPDEVAGEPGSSSPASPLPQGVLPATVPSPLDGNAGTDADAICFATPTNHEISVGGAKIIGSAQTRLYRHRGLLQHGTIALSHDPALYELLDAPPGPARLLGLRDLLPAPLTIGSLIEVFAGAFAVHLKLALTPQSLTAVESARADELVRVRYATDAWLNRC